MTADDNLKEDSFLKRYAVKVATSISGIFLGIILAGIVPRSLGAKNYGDYSFLTNIFSQIVNFLDMRASTCLYVKLSQNRKDLPIIRFYNFYVVLIILLMLAGTWAITSNPILLRHLLPAQQTRFVYLALIFAVTLFVQTQLAKMMDSFGLTVYSEKTGLLLKIVNVALVFAFFKLSFLNLSVYFYTNIATSLCLVAIILFSSRKIPFSPILSLDEIRKYSSVFYRYCAPLGLYMVIGFASEYFDRWLLQKCGGSVQQGYYAFAFSISNMSVLAVSNIYLLFTREVSAAVGRNDLEAVAKLFNGYVPVLYAIVSFFACFIFFQSGNIISLFGGQGYGGAASALKVLSIYPLVSTFSMMSGAVIYATDRTTIFRNISFVTAPLGILVSTLLISPAVGLGWGAAGLGLKNISIEFASVMVILFLNTRYLKMSFRKYFFYILYIPVVFMSCAILSSLFSGSSAFSASNALYNVLIAGVLYTIISIILIYLCPRLIYRERRELTDFAKIVGRKLQIVRSV